MKREALNKSEVIKIVEQTNDKQMKAIISTLILTGGRISEVLNIKAKDLWKEEPYLCIRMIILKRRSSVRPEIIRKFPINTHFTKFLINWINKENEFEPDDFIFPYTRQTVDKKLKAIEPDLHAHLFRHSLATIMGKKVDMKTMQDWFGWSQLNMAQNYVHNKDAVNTFAKAMEEFE